MQKQKRQKVFRWLVPIYSMEEGLKDLLSDFSGDDQFFIFLIAACKTIDSSLWEKKPETFLSNLHWTHSQLNRCGRSHLEEVADMLLRCYAWPILLKGFPEEYLKRREEFLGRLPDSKRYWRSLHKRWHIEETMLDMLHIQERLPRFFAENLPFFEKKLPWNEEWGEHPAVRFAMEAIRYLSCDHVLRPNGHMAEYTEIEWRQQAYEETRPRSRRHH